MTHTAPEIERPQSAHDEEVARQRVLAQVVVGEVQHLGGDLITWCLISAGGSEWMNGQALYME